MSREAIGEALRLIAVTATSLAALRGVEALGPLRAMLMPLPLPVDMLSTLQPAVALSREDRQAARTLCVMGEVTHMLPSAAQRAARAPAHFSVTGSPPPPPLQQAVGVTGSHSPPPPQPRTAPRSQIEGEALGAGYSARAPTPKLSRQRSWDWLDGSRSGLGSG
ncbi:hypothetical protein V8C86DRAFT_3022388 [Haematococcus lacustris]